MSNPQALHDDLLRRFAPIELPHDRAPLPAEVRESMAVDALRSVIKTHSPADGIGTWITCAECCNQAWPPPENGGIWSGTDYPCATVQGIAVAYGLIWTDQFGTTHRSGGIRPLVAPNGCDDCSVEPGERHRHEGCPSNVRQQGLRATAGSPHVLIVETVRPITDDNGTVIDRNYEVSIECPGVTDACAEWEECGEPGCPSRRSENTDDWDTQGHDVHGVQHRWWPNLGYWGVRTGACFAALHGHDIAEEVAERNRLGVGPHRVEPEFDDGSLQDLVLVGEQAKDGTRG